MVPLTGDGKVEYRENKLGIVFSDRDIQTHTTKTGKKEKRITAKKLVSSLAEEVDPFKKLLSAAAIKKGYYAAEVVVFLSDGARLLEKCCELYFPKAVRILDWYHAIEHVWDCAKKVFGEENDDVCTAWVKPIEHLLWNGKVTDVLELLNREILKRKKKQQPFIELRGYFSSNKENMKYNECRENGWICFGILCASQIM